jgi:hypothetical protein
MAYLKPLKIYGLAAATIGKKHQMIKCVLMCLLQIFMHLKIRRKMAYEDIFELKFS